MKLRNLKPSRQREEEYSGQGRDRTELNLTKICMGGRRGEENEKIRALNELCITYALKTSFGWYSVTVLKLEFSLDDLRRFHEALEVEVSSEPRN